MTINRRTQIKFRQLGVITIAWILVGCLMAVYDHLVLHTHNSLGPSSDYSFSLLLMMNMIAAVVGSMIGGSLLVFYISEKFQEKPYGYTIIAVSLFFALVILIVVSILGMVTVPMKTGKALTDEQTAEAFKDFLLDPLRAKNIMMWFIVVVLTQFVLQINSKFGHGALGNIIRGKYNTPKEEKKIFMFLDLNSSTAMAEKLGDEKYHELLKNFFADITNPILDNKGEIYQYVGDEVIVAWNYDEGIENSQCIQCFFDIKAHIDKLKDKYLQRYGMVPSFKAGIHYGTVVAGEVGIMKRDITYSGDVLNTTSRILNMCKEFNAEVISSADLIEKLRLSSKHYLTQPLGSIKLRGKEKEMMLSALRI
jgi:adenylate cyclase